jgi:2-phosphoglycerate kinase
MAATRQIPISSFLGRRNLTAPSLSLSLLRRKRSCSYGHDRGTIIRCRCLSSCNIGAGVHNQRSFLFTPKHNEHPKLILIGGCTGTGKSTLAMSAALREDILRTISTDTVRAVMRSFISPEISPALHRSSYSKPAVTTTSHHPGDNINSNKEKHPLRVVDDDDDPVRSWLETCAVLQKSIRGLVDDSIRRGVSIVVEGVHIVPGNDLLDEWKRSGGVAVGCLLTITGADSHKALLFKRGEMTKKGEAKKLDAFDRVRAIQEEMIRLAKMHHWLIIEQKLEPDPLEILSMKLYHPSFDQQNDSNSNHPNYNDSDNNDYQPTTALLPEDVEDTDSAEN